MAAASSRPGRRPSPGTALPLLLGWLLVLGVQATSDKNTANTATTPTDSNGCPQNIYNYCNYAATGSTTTQCSSCANFACKVRWG